MCVRALTHLHAHRLNDNNLELVFPSMELLRATVEKLSPIMVKGKIVVYVTYKPSIQNYAAPPAIMNRRLRRPATAAALAAGRGRPIARASASARALSNRASARKVAPQPPVGVKSKAQRNKNRLKPPRLRGVFTDGVQPTKVVMVVDKGASFVSTAILKGQASLPGAVDSAPPLEDSLAQLAISKGAAPGAADEGHTVISGSSLSMEETLQLIMAHPILKQDNNLFVVVPSLAWLFKDVQALVKDGNVMTLLTEGFSSCSSEEQSLGALVDSEKPKTVKKEQKQERPQLQLLQQVISDHGSLSPVDQQVLVRPVKHSHYTDEPRAPLLLRLLLRRLVHTALTIRAAVKAVTTNSEVIFCGIPAHHMTTHAAEMVLASVISSESAAAIAQAAVESVRLFNVFAVNSWMLGGFKIASFNDKPYLPKAALPAGGDLVNGVADTQANGDVSHDTPTLTKETKEFPTPEQLRLLQEAMPGDVTRGASVDAVTQVLGRMSSPDMVTLSPLALLDWLDDTCSLAVVCLTYMKSLTTALSKLRHRGTLVPWGPVPTEDFDEASVMPDIVQESVDSGIYTVQKDGAHSTYYCTQCNVALGGVRSADAHAYTRRHFNTVRWLLRTRSKEGTSKEDSKQDGGNKDGSKQDSGNKDGTKQDGGNKDDSKQDGGNKDGSKQDGGNKDNSKQDGGNKDDSKQDGGNKKSVLTGTATPSVFIPLKKEYIDRLVAYNVIKLVDNTTKNTSSSSNASKITSSEGTVVPVEGSGGAGAGGGEQRYVCVVCGGKQSTTFDGPGLRFHLHFHRHRVSLNNLLEVPVHRALVAQQENWSLFCSLMHHPSLDVVVVADDRHSASLSILPGFLSNRVHLVTTRGLLIGGVAAALAGGLAAVKKRSAMWLILAGCDTLTHSPTLSDLPKDADQLLQPLIQLHAQLRHLLPPDHLVVIAPLMPLQLLPLDVQCPPVLSNCLSVPLTLHSGLSDCYTALQKRSMRLHKATAQLCNTRGFGNLRSIAVTDAVVSAASSSVSSMKDVTQVPPLVDTEWHVALRMFVSAAGAGLPTLLPRPLPGLSQSEPRSHPVAGPPSEPRPHPASGLGQSEPRSHPAAGPQSELRPQSFNESELHSLIAHATFICPSQYLKKGPRFDSEKPLVLEWQLDFKEPSVGFIRSKASATDLGNCVVWYLTCPVAELFLDSADALQCCLANDCTAPLPAYFAHKE
ncbi:hypothetical protein FHG87_024745 [Trinorchestia longiramus]|nr:hypothetical protein FHG87_024745 [Trinorchestia longiramus]